MSEQISLNYFLGVQDRFKIEQKEVKTGDGKDKTSLTLTGKISGRSITIVSTKNKVEDRNKEIMEKVETMGKSLSAMGKSWEDLLNSADNSKLKRKIKNDLSDSPKVLSCKNKIRAATSSFINAIDNKKDSLINRNREGLTKVKEQAVDSFTTKHMFNTGCVNEKQLKKIIKIKKEVVDKLSGKKDEMLLEKEQNLDEIIKSANLSDGEKTPFLKASKELSKAVADYEKDPKNAEMAGKLNAAQGEVNKCWSELQSHILSRNGSSNSSNERLQQALIKKDLGMIKSTKLGDALANAQNDLKSLEKFEKGAFKTNEIVNSGETIVFFGLQPS